MGLQLSDPLPSAQGVPRDDRFVELGTAGGDAGLGLGLGDQRGDVGQDLGGQEGPGLLGLGGYFCLGGDQGVGKVGSGGWLGDELDGAFWLS